MSVKRFFAFWVSLFAVITVLFFVTFPLRFNGAFRAFKIAEFCVLVTAFLVFIGFCIWKLRRGKITMEFLTASVFVIAIVLRIHYMLVNPIGHRNHDAYLEQYMLNLNPDYANTHPTNIAYINLFVGTFGLPPSNNWQFYHPPFFYMVCALIANPLMWIFSPKFDPEFIIGGSTYIINCFCSCVFLYFAYRILKMFNFNKKIFLCVFTILAFNIGVMSQVVYMNNDAMALMFIAMSVYYSVIWYRNPNLKTAIIIGLCMGFGMMTKISVMFAGLFVGGVVVAKFFEGDKKNVYKACAIIAAIALPIGGWFLLRNVILFHQSPFYAPKPFDPRDSSIAGKNPFIWIFSFPIWDIIKIPYTYVNVDVNIFTNFARTFGQSGRFDKPPIDTFAVYLSLTAAFFMLFVLYTTVRAFIIAVRERDVIVILTLLFGLVLFVTYVIFTINWGYISAQDFRYVAFMIVPMCVSIGYVMQKRPPNGDDPQQLFGDKFCYYGAYTFAVLFAVLGVLFLSAITIFDTVYAS